MTLYENGVSSVKDLESYVRDDIDRYGTKLGEIQRRLENAYKESLSVSNIIGLHYERNGTHISFDNSNPIIWRLTMKIYQKAKMYL